MVTFLAWAAGSASTLLCKVAAAVLERTSATTGRVAAIAGIKRAPRWPLAPDIRMASEFTEEGDKDAALVCGAVVGKSVKVHSGFKSRRRCLLSHFKCTYCGDLLRT